MEAMFQSATGFNQDLSGWCVDRIPSEPVDFRSGAIRWDRDPPVWGTCPSR